ncbi:hypothetical protein GPJ56_007707 [Histomonas meleagridis]|nr:hypothetical protein GPJ56_007707 [Histomonas meleagridis]
MQKNNNCIVMEGERKTSSESTITSYNISPVCVFGNVAQGDNLDVVPPGGSQRSTVDSENKTQGTFPVLGVNRDSKTGTSSESELESESSSQSESEEPPRPKNWLYEFPYYFDEGNDDSSSQAFSQEMNGYYEVESIVNFMVEEDSNGVDNALWCVCWNRINGEPTPLINWEPTKNLSHCKNAVAFFIAMLKDGSSKKFSPPSSRLIPALRAAEAGNLFTVQAYQRYFHTNRSTILGMRQKYLDIQRKEDDLVFYLKGIDSTPRTKKMNNMP